MIVCKELTCKQLRCIKTEEMIPNAVYFNAVVFFFLKPPPLKPLVYTNYYNPPTNTSMTGKVCCEKPSSVNIYYFRVYFL